MWSVREMVKHSTSAVYNKNDYSYNNDDGVGDSDGDEDDNVSNEHFAAAILMKADNRALVSDCGSTMGL